MIKYECTKELHLQKYDENGYCVENETIAVKQQTEWYVDEVGYNLVSGDGAVRLLKISESNTGSWIEIHQDTLEEHFIKID